MAKKTITLSDLSGQDVPEGDEVEVRVLELEGLSEPVRLDASKTEVDRLRVESTSLALLELVMPDGETVRLALPSDQFRSAIRGDADEVLANAEGLSFAPIQPEPEQPRRRARRPRGEGAPAADRGEKINYTDSDHFGQLHRGRLTDEEVTLVKGNPDQASRNREAQGHPAIDWSDAKERSRYGLTDADVERMTAAMTR